MSRRRNSSDALELSCTIILIFVPATNSSPMWYTSVSGLITSFLSPADFTTCRHILVSDSSALHVNQPWGCHCAQRTELDSVDFH